MRITKISLALWILRQFIYIYAIYLFPFFNKNVKNRNYVDNTMRLSEFLSRPFRGFLSKYQYLHEAFQRLILFVISTLDLHTFYIFQGGTALRHVYGSPRFSLDLDFTIVNRDIKTLIDDSKRITARLEALLAPDEITVKKTREKCIVKELFYRYFITFDTIHYVGKKTRVKVELLIRPYKSLSFNAEILTLHYPFETSFGMRVKTPSQILSDKISALAGGFHRGYIRWRDVFDIFWIIDKYSPTLKTEYFLQEFGSWIEQKEDLYSLREKLHEILIKRDFSEPIGELEKILPGTLLSHDLVERYISSVLRVVNDAINALE